MKIELLQDMTSSVSDGHRTIEKGTVMQKSGSQLSWTYFTDEKGRTLVIQGFGSDDWKKVKILN